jgi:hypothetical protein
MGHWRDHVWGDLSVGVYPLVYHTEQTHPHGFVTQWMVKWGCVDVDLGYEASWPIALNLQKALNALGIVSFIEITKSKGYHVWVFAADWVPAATMQHALRFACQLVDYTPKEVNPKQTELTPELPLGNYVNIPYAKKWVAAGKRVVVLLAKPDGPVGWHSLEGFLEVAEANLSPTSVLAEAAALWVPPPPPKPVVFEPRGVTSDRFDDLPLLARHMLNEGPLPSKDTGIVDRSSSLLRFATACRNGDVAPHEAYSWLVVYDAKWMQKYTGRRDADKRYTEIIERAFQ